MKFSYLKFKKISSFWVIGLMWVSLALPSAGFAGQPTAPSHLAGGGFNTNSSRYYAVFQVGGVTWAQAAAWAAAFVGAGAKAGVLTPAATVFFGDIGAVLGGTAEWVANNWTLIGPLMQRASLTFAGASASYTAGSILRLAPTVLLGLTAAGVLVTAVYQARMAALAASAQNEAREWQMSEAQAATIARSNRRDGFRVPAFTNTNDIIITGPSSDRVAEQNIQNYIQAAFRARGNPSATNLRNAETALLLVYRAADTPRPSSPDDF